MVCEFNIHPSILKHFKLNDSQKKAIANTEGPTLIISGPGSGKTFVLVLRTLNILLRSLAEPDEIVLCTFTEKSAFELRDRLFQLGQVLGCKHDLSIINVNTIHGLSNDFVSKNIHSTDLGNNFELLDDLTQSLFILDNFNAISGFENNDHPYFNTWKSKWGAIDGLTKYFNKISEELIDPDKLRSSNDIFLSSIGDAYLRYLAQLRESNKTDFSLIQKYFLRILKRTTKGLHIRIKVKYVMVDEYQDTNYIQEQLLLSLASNQNNICVVGDEDQSLYRFRGATVRNILEFSNHFQNCETIEMTVNYRSHEKIIEAYNRFMKSWDWGSASSKLTYRYDKEISPDPDADFPNYQAVFAIWGIDAEDEAERFADMIFFLKNNGIIEDYSQVALLLHSVRQEHSSSYTDSLEEHGIPYYCPRQRGFFEAEEIAYLIASLSVVFGYFGEGRPEPVGSTMKKLCDYVDENVAKMGKLFPHPHKLALQIQKQVQEIENLNASKTLDKRLSDFLYELMAMEPFKSYLGNENRARNIAIFSKLLNVFQNYYHYTVITKRNLNSLKLNFFNSFLRLLFDRGVNEFDDPFVPSPKSHVQIMTIHQSKGLEFPVAVVGSLNKTLSTQKEIDKVLGKYYYRTPYEPLEKITGFDRMRLHYVAFSRPQKILVLTSHETPNKHFKPIWQDLDQWPYVKKDLLRSLSFELKNKFSPKRNFSFTGDISSYENCPRQYKFYNEYNFIPSRSAGMLFGTIVHQTIEEIHRYAMEGKLNELDAFRIQDIFNFNYKHLRNQGLRPLGDKQKILALNQVQTYFDQNKDYMNRIVETEVDVSIEKEKYILSGKLDLLLSKGDTLDILDFKTMKKPTEDKELIETYRKQLSIYGYLIEKKFHKTPDKLIIYWTSENIRENAIMSFPYDPKVVNSAISEFDSIVNNILRKEFNISTPPEIGYCRECDLSMYCIESGTIKVT